MKTIILPGMGADSRMYPGKDYERLADVAFVEWPKFTGQKTIEDVARSVIGEYRIDKQCIIGGSSLGGMVALEIAKSVGIAKVLLIGSATNPSYVNPTLEKLSALAELTPLKLIQTFVGKANLSGMHIALSMFEQADPDFIKAMCKAIFRWEGKGDYKGEICQVHGSEDKVIFAPQADVQIIEGGGHVISMTHGHIISEFLERTIRSH